MADLGVWTHMNLVPKPAPLMYDLNLYVEVNTMYREQYEDNESLWTWYSSDLSHSYLER